MQVLRLSMVGLVGLLFLVACNPVPPAEVTSTTPTSQASPVALLTPTSGETTAQAGTISGTLDYPSDGVPNLLVYAINTDNPDRFYTTRTESGETNFTIIGVTPGDYYIVAYLEDAPDAGLVGGYTAAVACGLTVECTDHTLIPVSVAAGETTTGVDVRDWYAPAGTLPARPDAPPAAQGTTVPPDGSGEANSLLNSYTEALSMAVSNRNYEMMQNLMGDPFTITGWRSAGNAWPPTQAVEQLRTRFYGPEGSVTFPDPEPDLATLLGVSDPNALWGEAVNVVRTVYSTGWGPDGNDDALLLIAQRPDGAFYWHGIVFATGGF